MPIAAGPLIAAGITAAGAGASVYAQGKTNRKTRQWNEMMYGRQRADSIADWHMQNEYNSPAAQMQRFKDAGLNPNLIYGQTNDAGPIRPSDSKSWNPSSPDFSGIAKSAIEGIGAYQDYTLQQEQVKNMQAQRKNMEIESALKTLALTGSEVKNEIDKVTLSQRKELYDTVISTQKEQLRNLSGKTDIAAATEQRAKSLHPINVLQAMEELAKTQTNRKQMEQQIKNLKSTNVLTELEAQMRKTGVTFNDNIVFRMLAQFMDGKSPAQIFEEFQKTLSKGEQAPTGVEKHKDKELINIIRRLRTK